MRWLIATLLAMTGFDSALPAESIPVPQSRPARHAQAAETAPGPETHKCRLELAEAGVSFKPVSPPGEFRNGCSISDPVEISKLPGGVTLEPSALLDCPTALSFAKFVTDKIQPLATSRIGSPIARIRQDSAYVCRTRNGATKLSEHAFGRALDIASFTTAGGLVIPVMAMPKDREIEASFLTAVRAAACGPFATVLGPGGDADHATHFHFDLAPRKGSPYCR